MTLFDVGGTDRSKDVEAISDGWNDKVRMMTPGKSFFFLRECTFTLVCAWRGESSRCMLHLCF